MVCVYLWIVLLKASRGEQDEAAEVGRPLCQAACDSIYEQRGTPQAVTHCSHSIRLLVHTVASAASLASAGAAWSGGMTVPSHPAHAQITVGHALE